MVGTDVSFNFNYEIGSSPISVRALLFGRCPGFALCPAVMLSIKMEMNLEDWWNDTDGGTENCDSATSSTNVTPIELGPNTGFRDERSSTGRPPELARPISVHCAV